jgi:hypothetical protein
MSALNLCILFVTKKKIEGAYTKEYVGIASCDA